MFFHDTLGFKPIFRRKSGRSTPIRSTLDRNPLVESISPTLDNTTSLPLSSKTRKPRLFSSLTHLRRTSLGVFKKDLALQKHSAVSPRTTSATLESSSHTLDVLEDGTFPIVPSQTEHQEDVADFGLISSTVDESPNREDGLLGLGLDPPGSRISVRVTSLRMRTAAVWDSIPATMDGGSAGDYSEVSTPVKSQIISQECDETESIEYAMVYSPSFSSPATSVTAVSDLSPRNSLSRLTMINRKQGLTCITPKALPAAALNDISLAQSPEMPGLVVAELPPEGRMSPEEEPNYSSSNSPASGCGSFPDNLSRSLEEPAILRAASPSDSPSPSLHTSHTLSNTTVCPITTKQSLTFLPVVQLFTNSDEDFAASNTQRSSPTLFKGSLATEMPLHPWSCAKITRAKTKRASRKEQGFFTRISHILEAGPQKHLSVSFEAYAHVA